MAFTAKPASFNKILILVFGIAFGLVGLALVFQGAKTSSDIRSRAAQSNQIYKQWEFNGKVTEGWKAVSPYTAVPTIGYLRLSAGKVSALPTLRNTSVGTKLPAGLKTISLSLLVGPDNVRLPRTTTTSKDQMVAVTEQPAAESVKEIPDATDEETFQRAVSSRVACRMEAKACPDGSYVGRSGASCAFAACPSKNVKQRKYVAHLYYKLSGQNKYERPIAFSGVMGTFQTHNLNLPQSGAIAIDSIRIVFTSGVKNGEIVLVDWIRLLGPLVKPPPSRITSYPTSMPRPTGSAVKCTPLPTCAYSTDASSPACKISAYAPDGGSWCPKPSVYPSTNPTPQQVTCTADSNGNFVCVTVTPTPTPTPSAPKTQIMIYPAQ